MNVAIPASPRTRTVRAATASTGAACLLAAVPLLTAGCSAAPAGATANSPAVGQTGAATPSDFPPFQVPATWSGYHSTGYRQVQKAVTGKKPRNLHITVGRDLVFWLGCLGTGNATLKSPGLGLDWSIRCGTRPDPQSVNFSPTTGISAGRKVLVLVTATPGACWEVRVDAPVS